MIIYTLYIPTKSSGHNNGLMQVFKMNIQPEPISLARAKKTARCTLRAGSTVLTSIKYVEWHRQGVHT
jgi:hypothetical protein